MDNDLHCDPMRLTRNVRLIIVISYIYDFIIIRHSGSIRVPVFGPYYIMGFFDLIRCFCNQIR